VRRSSGLFSILTRLSSPRRVTGEDVEAGTAMRRRIDRSVSDDHRGARCDQLTSIREESRIDGYAGGKVFEVRHTPADTRN